LFGCLALQKDSSHGSLYVVVVAWRANPDSIVDLVLRRLALVVDGVVDELMEKEVMDENRIVGTAKNIGGKVQEGYGRVVSDAKVQAEGMANQVKGATQDLYGQARDSASEIVNVAGESAAAARQTVSSFETSLRQTIEMQPYAAVFVALGLGWLLGRMHRPV
jgi:uncharacterized protein YjbJ (UPF0337 family)